MKKKLSHSLKFAIQQRSIAENSLRYYSTGHWIDKNEEKHVIEHAEHMRYESENAIIIWDWIIDTLKEVGIK